MDRFLEDGKPLKKVLDDLMKESHLDEKLLRIEINDRWEELAGPLVARHTLELLLFKRRLTIHLDSAPLKQEVNYRKKALLDKINAGLGKIVINEVTIK